MKKLWCLFTILSVLPAAGVYAAESQGRRVRGQPAAPGPNEDLRILCDRILSQEGSSGGYSDRDNNRRDQDGPDDTYDGI